MSKLKVSNEGRLNELLKGNKLIADFQTKVEQQASSIANLSKARINALRSSISTCNSILPIDKLLRSKEFKAKITKKGIDSMFLKEIVPIALGISYPKFAEMVKIAKITVMMKTKFIKACEKDESLSASLKGLILFAGGKTASKDKVGGSTKKASKGGGDEAKDGGDETKDDKNVRRFQFRGLDVQIIDKGDEEVIELNGALPQDVVKAIQLFLSKIAKVPSTRVKTTK